MIVSEDCRVNRIDQQVRIFILATLVGIVGCSGNSLDTQKPTDVVQRDLTRSERAERTTLYEQLHVDLRAKTSEPNASPYWTDRLEGTLAADYQSFLNLADETGRFGDKRYYEFVFRTESDSDPNRFKEGDAWLTIVVEDNVITHVGYDVMVR